VGHACRVAATLRGWAFTATPHRLAGLARWETTRT